MSSKDLQQALEAIEPTTKAAKVRQFMPVIERKLEQGVRIEVILETLRDSGIELTKATLKSYLYRYRQKQKSDRITIKPADGHGDSFATNTENLGQQAGAPVSLQELDRVMTPDPAAQAAELAGYERLSRQTRRSRK